MKSHAMKYSQGYASDVRKGTSWTFWSKDFDGMAMKTMLRQLISKWGVMSIDMQTALETDMATIKPDLTPEYVDTEEVPAVETVPAQAEEQPVQAPQKGEERTETVQTANPSPEAVKPQEQAQRARGTADNDIAAALFGGQ